MQWQGVMSLLQYSCCRSLFDAMDTKDKIENLEGEVWKDIVGYEGLYQVSNKGRVKSLRNNIILKQSAERNGYPCIVLSVGNKPKTFYVHHLVSEAFVGNRPKGRMNGDWNKKFVINHKDENRLNNNIENLEIITQSENIKYGTAEKRRLEKLSQPLFQYSLDGKLIKYWKSARECHRNGFHASHVSESCQGIYGRTKDRQVYKGYIWSYIKLTTEQCVEIANKKCNKRLPSIQKKVYQYDLNGNIVQVWSNVAECIRHGFTGSKVSACCYRKEKSHHGFIWRFEKMDEQEAETFTKEVRERLNKYQTKRIYQYTLDYKLVKIWENQHECNRNGFDQGCVSACCHNKRTQYKGYIWSFKPLNIK